MTDLYVDRDAVKRITNKHKLLPLLAVLRRVE